MKAEVQVRRVVSLCSVIGMAALVASLASGGNVRAAETDPAPAALSGGGPARKVLVVAKIEEAEARNTLERVASEELRRKGVEALVGSEVLTAADLESADALRAKAETLGIDGLLGFFVLEIIDGETTTRPMDVYVDVPYHVGPYWWFAGSRVTLEGTVVSMPKITIAANFYNRPTGDPAWEKSYADIWRPEHRERIVKAIAHDSVRLITRKNLAGGSGQ